MIEFAEKAETLEGNIKLLRRGFPSQDAAEDHPVQMSLWRRVWVEPIESIQPKVETVPPFPWNVTWVGGYAYVIDADGRKIASLLGSQKRREYVAAILCDLGTKR